MFNKKLHALLLAAGRGTRLLPLTETIPKPLIPILDMPISAYIMKFLSEFGYNNLTFNSHHLPEKLESSIRNSKPVNAVLSFSKEPSLLGTGGGIKKMIKISGARDQAFLISNTDALYNFDIGKLRLEHEKSGNNITLILMPFKKGIRYSVLSVDKNNHITGFSAKPDLKSKENRYGFFTGIHFIDGDKITPFPDKEAFCIVKDYYEPLLNSSYKIGAVFAEGEFHETGNPADFYSTNVYSLINHKYFPPLNLMIKSEYRESKTGVIVHRDCSIPPETVFKPPVFIGKGCNILPGCKLGPGVIISGNSKVGKNSLLEKCMLINQTVLGDLAVVKNEIRYGIEKIDLKV